VADGRSFNDRQTPPGTHNPELRRRARANQKERGYSDTHVVAGKLNETVHLIDWVRSEKNHVVLAEELTLEGGYGRRPDIVLYLNGLAIAVIELRRSTVEPADGVR
jgi:type I site-specific restriction-modification system R (restriction) subunit